MLKMGVSERFVGWGYGPTEAKMTIIDEKGESKDGIGRRNSTAFECELIPRS